MSQKMQNAPVYFTIAQVRFNPVLSLDTYMAGIQESLRKAGYPDFKKRLTLAFSLTPMGSGEAGQSPPVAQTIERYAFLKMDGRSGFTLGQNALSYEITEYDTFETLSADFAMGLEIVHKAIGLNFSERVGIRYLDVAVPPSGANLGQLLAPEVMGLGTKLKGIEVSHSFAETLFQFPGVGSVMARTMVQSGQLGFPPDLQPEGLKIAERFQSVNGQHAVIDTDAFFEGREVFKLTTVTGRLSALHDKIHECFHATVTDYARSVWK